MVRKILSWVTLAVVAVIVWASWGEVSEALSYLSEMNVFVLLLLIPEQLYMYYCAGQMFFSYLRAKKDIEVRHWDLMRISCEINFVKNMTPSGGVWLGLGYVTWRLKKFGATVGQISFVYILRYLIVIIANLLQTMIALAVIWVAGCAKEGFEWVLWLAIANCVVIAVGVIVVVLVASSREKIEWFSKVISKLINGAVRAVTLGRRRKVVDREKMDEYFWDLHADVLIAKRSKGILVRPFVWGMLYSFFEVATYWVVGISMGHPEILPQILVGEAIASTVGAVLSTPSGIGGYEGAMIFVMMALGVDVGLATAVVVTTRVIVLLGTIVSGWGFYQHAITTVGRRRGGEVGEDSKA